MKTIKTLALFLGLALGIASCSKEGQDSPVLVERQVEGASKHVGSKDSVLVSFTIGADTEELRLAQSLNADGVPVSPFMEEKDVVIRFAVRRNYNGQRYVTYTDAVCKKVAGENKAIYKGGIRLPDIGYGTYPAGSRPSMEGHEIAGVLLGEANNGTKFVEEVDANTVKSIEQTELLTSESDVVRSKVPYILDWMAFPLTADGVQQQKLTLHFKPVGNLLRLQFNNQFDEDKTLESIKVVSNAFVTQAKFDFTAQTLRQSTFNYSGSLPITASGNAMSVLANDYQMEKNYNLETPLYVEARSKSKWHYLWVMPIAYTAREVRLDRISYTTQITGRASDGKDYNMIGICSPLSEGSNKLKLSFKRASTIESAFKGGKLPLWYIAEYDVAKGGKTLANTNVIPPLGRNDYETSSQMALIWGYFSKEQFHDIDVTGYYIPNVFELSAIQPISYGMRNFYLELNAQISLNTPQKFVEDVIFPGETSITKVNSLYQVTEEQDPLFPDSKRRVAYALRFEECGNKDKLTAYRYTFNGYNLEADLSNITHFTQSTNFEVSSVFLGSGFIGDISTISNSSFWANSPSVVTRVFPLLGRSDRGLINSVRSHGDRISKDALFVHSDRNNFSSIMEVGNFLEGRAYPVRLIKNEFKTAQ